MKVDIITRHSPANYGSLLQAIATQKIITSLGYKCEIINYIPKEETCVRTAFTQLKNKKEWNNSIIKKFIYIAGRLPENIIMYHRFNRMRKKHLILTRLYHDTQELKKKFTDKGEIFMTGSDQVWGPTLTGVYNPAYFFDFVPDGKKMVSFAASFGKSEFNGDVLSEYQSYLQRYSRITVREHRAVQLVNQMGLDADQVLDPTLLITAKSWQNYVKGKTCSNYVLVYQIHNNPKFDDYAKTFAKKARLPLIRVSAMLHQANRGGKFSYLPDIGKFLSLIKNATYMITDSFHGTAFAINFNTQFVDVLPNNGTSSRNQSILQLTGLENRIVTDLQDFHYINDPIDFTQANSMLKKERQRSIKILMDILS